MHHSSAGLNAWIPVVGTLLGVVLGGLVGYVVHWFERRRELRSVLQALLWELQDAVPRLSLPTAIFPTPTPSFDTLLSRGLLSVLPHDVAGRLLSARSMIQVHQHHAVDLAAHAREYDPVQLKYEAETLTELARTALTVLTPATEAIRNYLGNHAVSRELPIEIKPPAAPMPGSTRGSAR